MTSLTSVEIPLKDTDEVGDYFFAFSVFSYISLCAQQVISSLIGVLLRLLALTGCSVCKIEV